MSNTNGDYRMSDNQKAMYNGICQCRNTQITLRWSISQLFVVINLAGLSYIGTQRIESGTVHVIVSILGMVLNVLWYALNRKSQSWIEYWNTILANIDPPTDNAVEFRAFSGLKWKEINAPLTFYHYLNLISLGFMVLWILVPIIRFNF